MVELKTAIGGAVGGIVLILLGVLFFPLWQELGYTLFIQSPATLWWFAIGGVIIGASFKTEGVPSQTLFYGGIVVVVVFGLFIGPFFSGVYAKEHIVHNQDIDRVDTLPETSQEHVRVLPRNVANRYAESANQLPRYATGDSDIAYHNGSYTWAYGVMPDKIVLKFIGNQWGAFYVDMTQDSRSVETKETTMTHGMGMYVIDNYDYQNRLSHPIADHRRGTAFVFEHNDETHIAQSYVTHDWKFKLGPIPQPYAVPKYGGTIVTDSDGTQEDLSPSEVAQDERLVGQNTYPYQLARFRMSSMRLQHGLLNALFIGEDVPKIAETGGFSDNKQPFTVPTQTDDGSPELTYFIAATPASSGDGIYQIYTIDSQTGDIEYVQFDDTQAGPQKSAGYTRSQDREPNWKANNEDGSTQITEPIPLIIDGTLYWHMRVTPTDGSQISYTTFVNADTGDVIRADGTEQIYEFIDSNADESVIGNTTEDTKREDGLVSVVILDEDGSVSEEYVISENQTVEISATDEKVAE